MENKNVILIVSLVALIIIIAIISIIVIFALNSNPTTDSEKIDKGYKIFGNELCTGHLDSNGKIEKFSPSWTCKICGKVEKDRDIATIPVICSTCKKITGRCDKCGKLLVGNTGNNNNNSQEHIKFLEIASQNWGEVNIASDYFVGTSYEVYRDGYVYTYDSYNKSGKKNEKNYNVSIEDITKIENLLKSSINKPANKSASDGTGWTFRYLDNEGNEIGKYTGYIYNYNEFNEILQLLKK